MNTPSEDGVVAATDNSFNTPPKRCLISLHMDSRCVAVVGLREDWFDRLMAELEKKEDVIVNTPAGEFFVTWS